MRTRTPTSYPITPRWWSPERFRKPFRAELMAQAFGGRLRAEAGSARPAMQALIPGPYSTISAPKSLVDASERRRLRLSDPGDRDDLVRDDALARPRSFAASPISGRATRPAGPRSRSAKPYSRIRRRSEHATPCLVRPSTDPYFAVGTRGCFVKRNEFNAVDEQ